MTVEIRPITPETFAEFMLAEGAAFGARPTEAAIEQRRAIFELDHALAAFEDGRIVGTAGAYSCVLPHVGGACMPVRGVTCLSVLPTHRRRCILTALIRRQLDDNG